MKMSWFVIKDIEFSRTPAKTQYGYNTVLEGFVLLGIKITVGLDPTKPE